MWESSYNSGIPNRDNITSKREKIGWGGGIVKKNLLFYVYSTGIHRIHQHIRSHINRFHWEVIRKIKCLKIFLRGGDYEKKIEKDCLVKGLCHLTKPMALCRGIRWQQPAWREQEVDNLTSLLACSVIICMRFPWDEPDWKPENNGDYRYRPFG